MKRGIVWILFLPLVFSCREKQEHKAGGQAHSDHPMAEGALHLTDRQVQLGNIQVDSVKEHILGEELLIAGTLDVNQERASAISTRVMGRIEKLYFKTAGERISRGDVVYEIYSEELNMAVRELRLAKEKSRSLKNDQVDLERILLGVKNRLKLYGLTDGQILELENSTVEPDAVKILSPVSGVIISIDVKEGSYVMEGANTFHVADLSVLWVVGQVYPDYLDLIKEGLSAEVTLPAFPGKQYETSIYFISPELNSSSRINTVRLEIPNQQMELKPGLQAYVHVLTDTISAIAVPADAVIREEKSSTVWVRTARNMYESRMVTTGIEANGFTQIRSGVEKGEQVVVTGAYLLNSEFIFRKGINPMEGHDMTKMH